MPSSTPKQANFMRVVSHNPGFAKKVGVPQKVGQDFEAADQAKAAGPKEIHGDMVPHVVKKLRSRP